jgi:hypothetical protein
MTAHSGKLSASVEIALWSETLVPVTAFDGRIRNY